VTQLQDSRGYATSPALVQY